MLAERFARSHRGQRRETGDRPGHSCERHHTPAGVTLLDDKGQSIFIVAAPIAEEEVAVAATEGLAEPEVIGEKKEEGEEGEAAEGEAKGKAEAGKPEAGKGEAKPAAGAAGKPVAGAAGKTAAGAAAKTEAKPAAGKAAPAKPERKK